MPSARKRRLRKLIKGAVKAKDAVGGFIHGDGSPSAQQSTIDSINALPKIDPDGHTHTQFKALTTLLGLTTSAGLPTTSNPDGDGAQTGADFLPFDAREVKDTDGDNIGDNRDILLTKEIMDGIFFEKKNGAADPQTGTLYESISTQVSANNALATVVAMPEGDAVEKAAKKAALVALQAETVYTLTGLASLETKIVSEKSQVVSLKSQIAAMTADHGVKIDDAPFYDLAPYNDDDGSTAAFDDAAATSASAPADAAKAVIDQMETDVAAIEAL